MSPKEAPQPTKLLPEIHSSNPKGVPKRKSLNKFKRQS
jgi:hypothetical protein